MIYNKKEYNSGDYIGSNNVIFLQEVEPKYHQTYKDRQGIFICPYCKSQFQSSIREVSRNNVKSCGCHVNHRKGVQYQKGEIIGEYGVSFIEELPHDTNKREGRKALFKCPICGDEFKAYIGNVRYGNTKHCGCLNHPIQKGDRFGRLTAIKIIPLQQKIKHSVWECKCDCGNTVYAKSDNLVRGYKKSCGCLLKESFKQRKVDMTGKKFFHLTALEPTEQRENGGVVWKCICDCGKICYIPQGQLGYRKSCGCVSNRSKGEIILKDILQSNDITFVEQKTFEECVNPKTNRKLKFDFYLPNYNCCIEYNGKQHYVPIEHFGGQKYFEDYQYRDFLKQKFCNKNDIKLLVFSYQNSIQQILTILSEFLKKDMIYEQDYTKYVLQ